MTWCIGCKPNVDRAEKLERDLAAANAELVMWRDGNIVTGDVQQMKARIVALKTALMQIRDNGGTTTDDGLSCNGSWCAKQARTALEVA